MTNFQFFSVPPRVPTGRPAISSETDDSLLLSWSPARMPSYLRSTPITYIVEERELPTNLWRRLVEGIGETSFRVSNLRSAQEYMFRVRAQNEFGTSEPTLPVSLYRKSGQLSFPGPGFIRCHYTKSNPTDDNSNISLKKLQKQNFKPLGHYICMQCGNSYLQKVKSH